MFPPPVLGNSTVFLGDGDNGRVVRARVGDLVRVHLSGRRGDGVIWAWGSPMTSSGVLRMVNGGPSRNGDSDALFRVVRPGRDSLSDSSQCVVRAPGRRCPMIAQQWMVTVLAR
ncbi:hypothetical protein AB0C59_10660 [Streptomyces sp. NPDC048664]|uniref:hypothetical protein n=1 Tax=Streptomyces sp. NPDC048664 TaxID=3154505 RepID=UPI0034148F27